MSHEHERIEKVCLNCGAQPLYDRYCHHCGQENVEPKQTLGHLIAHFFNDVTHFDGKFFSTMKQLLFHPGFLSAEYVQGRRTTYLDPIRMYLFISALFFLVFSSLLHSPAPPTPKDKPVLDYIDSVRKIDDHMPEGGITFVLIEVPGMHKKGSLFDVAESMKHGKNYYDSFVRSLPPDKRPDFFKHYLRRQFAGIYQNYDTNPYNFVPEAINIFLHWLSKIFFISLPIFTFFLYLLYLRRKKEYYYVAHAIFSIHYYSVSFIFLFIILLTGVYVYDHDVEMFDTFLMYTAYVIFAGMVVYLYIAMLRFYKQGWFKTLIKTIALSLVSGAVIILLIFLMFMQSLSSVH